MTATKIDVSVLIVAYNSRDLLRECLLSLQRLRDPLRIEIIVVDNGDDDTHEMLASDFPQVTVPRPGGNVGFARAVNYGSRVAKGEYLLLLNPDTQVFPGAVAALVAEARANPRGGLYGGRTLNTSGEVDPRSAWGLPSVWGTFCWAVGLTAMFPRSRAFAPESIARWDRSTRRDVPAIVGCLLLVRKDVWSELGGFDERFYMYSEDIDLSQRAHEAGYHPVVVPEAVIVHHVGGTSAIPTQRARLVLKGKATYVRKHWGPGKTHLGITLLQTGVLLRAISETCGRRHSRQWRNAWRDRISWRRGY